VRFPATGLLTPLLLPLLSSATCSSSLSMLQPKQPRGDHRERTSDEIEDE
jgi:hypothetical protein